MPQPPYTLADHAAAVEAAEAARKQEWAAVFGAEDQATRDKLGMDHLNALGDVAAIEMHFADLFLFQLRMALRHRPQETADLLAEAGEVWKSFHPTQRTEPQNTEASKNGVHKS